MKIYLELPQESRGIARVRDNLIKYLPPGATVVKDRKQADLIIFHVIGRHDMVGKQVESAISRGQRYAMIQYCLRSTMQPHTKEWIGMWSGAECVWSYYDLNELRKEDGGQMSDNFYHAPLGIDPAFANFKPDDHSISRSDLILATSQGYLVESARECVLATQYVHDSMIYLGRELNKEGVSCFDGVDDKELASLYSYCKYVSGLRRIEGFELPVIEGLSCGARPIVFDQPHYRKWFKDFAVFIPENDRESTIYSLIDVFMGKYKPVTQDEVDHARQVFNWQTIITNFYNKL